MQKKYGYIIILCLAAALLTACEDTETSVSETRVTYGINETSMENSEQQNSTDPDAENSTKQKSDGSEYEIDDMLPRLSDDTLIMSVEEAEAFMKNKATAYTDVDEELSD